jgi:4-oxalocrotonate tautomerase
VVVKETGVPIIDVKVMEGVLSSQQKEAIAEGITDVFATAVGEPVRGVTWVVIQDITSGQWTMGGQPVTTEGVKELLQAARVQA